MQYFINDPLSAVFMKSKQSQSPRVGDALFEVNVIILFSVPSAINFPFT